MFYLPFLYALFVLRVRRESNACGRAHDPRTKRPVFFVYFRLRALCFTSASGVKRVWMCAQSSREMTGFFFTFVYALFVLRVRRESNACGRAHDPRTKRPVFFVYFRLRTLCFTSASGSNACGRSHDPRVRRPMFYLPFDYALFILQVRRESNACGRAHDPRMKRPVFFIYFRLRTLRSAFVSFVRVKVRITAIGLWWVNEAMGRETKLCTELKADGAQARASAIVKDEDLKREHAG
jgi:hypothetical protein